MAAAVFRTGHNNVAEPGRLQNAVTLLLARKSPLGCASSVVLRKRHPDG